MRNLVLTRNERNGRDFVKQCRNDTCAFLQFLADEVVARGAVSVVPHEGVRESLGGGGQAGVVVQPPQLHAVLLAEEVVVGLLQHVVVLTPAGEPV